MVRTSLLYIWLVIFLTGCSVVADIFEAGLWTGVIIVVVVVAIVIYFISKARKQ